MRGQDLPWGTYSAGILTHVVKKHRRCASQGQPAVFYPIKWKDAQMAPGPAEAVEAETQARRLPAVRWHSGCVKFFDAPPPRGSYIDVVCAAVRRRHQYACVSTLGLLANRTADIDVRTHHH